MKLSLAEYLRIAESLAFPRAPDTLQRVADALTASDTDHVLVGGFSVAALGAWPRATEDIDLLVWQRDAERLVSALESRFAPLFIERYPSLIRVSGAATIDIVLADKVKLRSQAMEDGFTIRVEYGEASLTLPIAESSVVLKLAAIFSPTRKVVDSLQDIADLGRLFSANPGLDVDLVVRLARPLRTRSPKEIRRIAETFLEDGTIAVDKRGSKPQVIFVPGRKGA